MLDDYWADDLPSRRSAAPLTKFLPTAEQAGEELELADDSWADFPPKGHRPSVELQLADHSPLMRAKSSQSQRGCSALVEDEDDDSVDSDRENRICMTDYEDIMRWVECARVGRAVVGTRIVPAKTPFEGPLMLRAVREELMGDGEQFQKSDLIERCRKQGTPVGLVIDLVNTYKYYRGFRSEDGVEYRKLRIAGHGLPEQWRLEEAYDLIDDFCKREPTKYVVVHCTHGVNRTGFFIAGYLLVRGLAKFVGDATSAFYAARGEKIDKLLLFRALHRLEVRGWY